MDFLVKWIYVILVGVLNIFINRIVVNIGNKCWILYLVYSNFFKVWYSFMIMYNYLIFKSVLGFSYNKGLKLEWDWSMVNCYYGNCFDKFKY